MPSVDEILDMVSGERSEHATTGPSESFSLAPLGPLVNRQIYENSPLSGSSVEERAAENGARMFNQKDPNLAILHEKPEHRIAIILKAQGFSHTEISKKLGYTIPWVSQILRQPWAREALLEEINKSGREAVGALLEGEAVNSVFRIVDLRDTSGDDGVRLRASQDLLDRHLGKATQRVETKNESFVVTGEMKDIEKRLAELREQEQHLSGAPKL